MDGNDVLLPFAKMDGRLEIVALRGLGREIKTNPPMDARNRSR